jgi:hypothetical protein
MKLTRITAVLGGLILSLGLAGTAFAATEGWAGNGWPVKSACDETPAGTTVWIWTGDNPTALTVNGVAQAGSWDQAGGGNSSWKFVTGWFADEPDHDTTFVTYTGDSGTLTITHGCAPETTPTPTPTPEASPTPTPEASPTPTPDASPTPTPEASPTPTPESTPTPTPTPTPGTTPTPTPDPSPTPEDSVGGATSTPTLPPTDTLGGQGSAPGSSTPAVLLVVLAGIVASALVLTPSRSRRRR